MKLTLSIVVFIILLLGLVLLLLVHQSKSDQALGLTKQKLARCPEKPNCVCSEYQDDSKHFISPLRYELNHADVIKTLQDSIEQMGGEIQVAEETYLATIFKSDLFGFIDDLEIRLDTENRLVHMRSASRVGYSDRGVNRKRIETIVGLLKSTPDFIPTPEN